MWRNRLQALTQAVAAALPFAPSRRLHAHLKLETPLRVLDVFLGEATFISENVTILDSQAPMAEVFFTTDEQSTYEFEVEGRLISGTLLEKHLLFFSEGRLAGAATAEASFRLVPDTGEWKEDGSLRPPPLPTRTRTERHAFRSPLEVTLDGAQRAAVELPKERHLLLLGEAGFGKTTVALHRLLHLRAQHHGHRRFRGAVLVPTEGLRRLTALMLERRGVQDVDVWTFDDWVAQEARRTFRDLPRKLSENTPSVVIALKRHPALRPALQRFVQKHQNANVDPDAPRRGSALASRADLEHFFGDRGWMQEVVDDSKGALFPSVLEAVERHTKIQFLDSSEKTYAHVDAEARTAIDGRGLDEGTPTEDANTVDAEDHSVMFELERLRCVASGKNPIPLGAYDVVVIDEAQEFAPIELGVMARALRHGGVFIVAGDAAQQVDPTAVFLGWDGVLSELGVPQAERVRLEVNYRCPPDVTTLARHLLDSSVSVTHTPSVTCAPFWSSFHLSVWLSDELRAVVGSDAALSVAVICRTPEAARRVQRQLRGVSTALALNGEFPFRPGVVITCVQEIKGLEFDLVILPDAGSSTWPETADARRGFYTAITRASWRLALAWVGPRSSLLPTKAVSPEAGAGRADQG